MKALNNDVRKALEELARRTGSIVPDAAVPEPEPIFLQDLFDSQREIIDHPSKRKALLCGRRYGKTTILCSALLKAAYEFPGSFNAYVGINAKKADELMWQPLKQFARRYHLDIAFNEGKHIATFPNGSSIWCTGCPDKQSAETFRGSKYHVIAIDEAGSFKDWLDYLIEEAIEPALMDYQGTLYLAGTPNRTCTGYFYEVTEEKRDTAGYHVWQYTMLDNPMFPEWAGKENWREASEDYLRDFRITKGWDESNSKFQREYMARWVRDSATNVVDFDSARNTYSSLPDLEFNYVLGVDFGQADEFCITLCAYSEYSPIFYVVDVYKDTELSYHDTCSAILEYDSKYTPEVIAADPTPGKLFIDDLSQQYNLPIRAAQKRQKAEFLDLLNDEFRQGRIKVNELLEEEIEELKTLQWIDKAKGKLTGKDHFFDALRYAHREVVGRAVLELPDHATSAFQTRLEDHQERLEQKIRKEQEDQLGADYFDFTQTETF